MSPLPNMVKPATGPSLMPDWSLLPDELLQIITEKMDNCFDVVHARSVCSSWRSTFAFPCSLLSPSYSLPTFNEFSLENEGLCTLKKIPLFLFSVNTPSSSCEYILGGIGRRDESEGQAELPSLIQCSVKIPGSSEQTLVNMLDCQILSLGYQYRMLGWEPEDYKRVAFLPLNKEGGGEFVVLLNCTNDLLVLTSGEMRWKRLENVPNNSCWDLVTFRGRFYASCFHGTPVVIDPYSLDVTLLIPSCPLRVINYLVPSGNDELFLVEIIFPPVELELGFEVDLSQLACRVSRLDDEEDEWVEVNDLGDRVLFIHHGHLGNVSCSAKELPHGCGVTRNSILVTYAPGMGNKTFSYKSQLHSEDACRIPTGNFVVIVS
ncbi:unnamed protein product [Microthlaspi erraticum]|uniref:F-box domain-containing protein n=1 Tax=Microthlaspi erraticum TaxID=1685480 RepID=A0A6D2IIS6_9BRAS|nr:unnamed protein product [Microthlaspi erraticum]CAA7032998.1 unnamed protein product [Microthlaspi erraticum]